MHNEPIKGIICNYNALKKTKKQKRRKKESTVCKNDEVRRVKANSTSYSLATKFWRHTHSKQFKSELVVFH